MIFLFAHANRFDLIISSQVKLRSCQIFFMSGRKPARKLLAYFRLRRKIWWNQQVQCQTRSLAPDLSDGGSHCFKLRRMVTGTRVEDISPANEAEGQNTTSARRTNCWRTDATPKLPQRETESSTDVDVDDIDLEISSFWLHEAYMVSENVWRTKKSKLEQHNTNAADEIIMAV